MDLINQAKPTGTSAINYSLPPAQAGMSAETLLLYCAANLRSLDTSISRQMVDQEAARGAARKLSELQAAFAPLNEGLDWQDQGFRIRAMTLFKEAYDAAPASMKANIETAFNKFYQSAINNDKPGQISLATFDQKAISEAAKLVYKADRNTSFDEGHNFAYNTAMSKEEIDGMNIDLKGLVSDVSKGAELAMIDLQSMVSQRQMAVQLTTNMLNKLNDTYMAVAGNVGK